MVSCSPAYHFLVRGRGGGGWRVGGHCSQSSHSMHGGFVVRLSLSLCACNPLTLCVLAILSLFVCMQSYHSLCACNPITLCVHAIPAVR